MLELELDGMKFEFRIDNYRTGIRKPWDDDWCMVLVKAICDSINYSMYEECMLCSEVEWLYNKIVELQEGTLKETTELSFIEPDFEFMLYPNGQSHGFLDWKFNLWYDGALTGNSFTIMFASEDIEKLREYLRNVISRGNVSRK